MKLTAKNIVLIILVLGVWSFVGYRAYNYFNPTIIEENTEENKITSLNHNISPQSNYIINDLDYIDPFLKEKKSNKKLSVINVHLASKRHQSSIFAEVDPGIDGKLDVRNEQTRTIQQEADALDKLGLEYYITGDFNDGEHSQPMVTLMGDESSNLVFSLSEDQRYDYNHRGKLQVLMHGVVPLNMEKEGRAQYEIIHGNELIGIQPGAETNKPSDHAYVIAKLKLK